MLAIVALPLFPLLLTGPAAALLYIALLKRDRLYIVWGFWALLAAATVCLGILIAYTFSDFFPGPGCFAALFTPASAALALLVFRLQASRFYQAVGDDASRRRRFQAAMLLLPALQLSAPLIGLGYSRSCDMLNRQAARPIIAALEHYRQDYGRYPVPKGYQSDLGFLVPQYLDAVPPRACKPPFKRPDSYPVDDDWSLFFCATHPGQDILLLVPVIGTDGQQIYDLKTGEWSHRNALDGYCP